jgi:hypothetical protein
MKTERDPPHYRSGDPTRGPDEQHKKRSPRRGGAIKGLLSEDPRAEERVD